MQELWAPVVGYEGLYEVSDQGRAKSLARLTCSNRQLQERILKPIADYGHLQVALYKEGRRKQILVHKLVAAAFIGPRPLGMEILHGVGGRTDNRLSNLSYGTHAENCADKLRDDTHIRGERHYRVRLTREQVLLARRLVASGPHGTVKRLSQEWGVSRSAVSAAAHRIKWAWLEDN